LVQELGTGQNEVAAHLERIKELIAPRIDNSGLPTGVHSFKVRLVGTLPGSGYDRILSTETLAVEVNEHPKESPKDAKSAVASGLMIAD
jgi:hypothetical protein